VDNKFLGAKPGIVQVLHTWGQKLDYHPHIHCIVTGGGLTPSNVFKVSNSVFFIPVRVLSKKFHGKFMALLKDEYNKGSLYFSASIRHLEGTQGWNSFVGTLYDKEWIPFIKETFNGQGNAIEYLGRYTHRIAISNSRIIEVTDTHVVFSAYDYRLNKRINVTLPGVEFIRRFLMHVLPKGFVKIRNFGFLSNRAKAKNILIIRVQSKNVSSGVGLTGLKIGELLLLLFNIDIYSCPICKSKNVSSSRSFRLKC